MDVERVADEAVVLTISAGEGAALVARETFARAFGIASGEAERLLARGEAILATRAQASESCLTLLRLLGVRVGPLHQAAPRFDLSLRLADPADVALRQRLAGLCPGADLAQLEGPEGLVLRDLGGEAARVWLALLRQAGVLVTLGAQAGAVHDLFAPYGFVAPPDLARYLAILGLDRSEQALACGLEAATLARVLARFDGLGLHGVHQAFQRCDLYITGTGALSRRDVADFLASRGLPGAFEALCEGRPIRLERELNRKATRQFLNDYRHIGLAARAVLSGRPGGNPQPA